MPLSDFLKGGAAKKVLRQQLVPGRVIHCPIMFGNPRAAKDKFSIYIGSRDDDWIVFVINSQPAPYILSRPDLLAHQVAIDPADGHDFLKYTSVVDCSKIHALHPGAAEKHLLANLGDVKCCISAGVRGRIVTLISSSKLYLPFDRNWIIGQLS